MSSWPVVLMLPDLCSTPFLRHFIGSFDLISFRYPSIPHVKHIMTYCILYRSCNTCFSNCTQSVGNISLFVLGVVVVDGSDDGNDRDDDNDSNNENTSVASNRTQNSTFI